MNQLAMIEAPNANEDPNRLKSLPPAVPLVWKRVADAGKALPYRTPREEYLTSPFVFNANELKRRWHGLAEPHEIDMLFCGDDMSNERRRLRLMIETNVALPDIESVEYRKHSLASSIAALKEQIDATRGKLQMGTEDLTRAVPDGLSYYQITKPENMSLITHRMLVKQLRELITQLHETETMYLEACQGDWGSKGSATSEMVSVNQILRSPELAGATIDLAMRIKRGGGNGQAIERPGDSALLAVDMG